MQRDAQPQQGPKAGPCSTLRYRRTSRPSVHSVVAWVGTLGAVARVVEQNHAIAERPRSLEPEAHPDTTGLEQRPALPEDHRMDENSTFVDQAVSHESGGQIGAAKGDVAPGAAPLVPRLVQARRRGSLRYSGLSA